MRILVSKPSIHLTTVVPGSAEVRPTIRSDGNAVGNASGLLHAGGEWRENADYQVLARANEAQKTSGRWVEGGCRRLLAARCARGRGGR